MGYITEFDKDVIYYIYNNLHGGFLDVFFSFIYFLSNGAWIWIAAGGAMLCSRKWRLTGVMLLLSLGISAVFGNYVLKNIFSRNRPFIDDPTIQLLIDIPHGYYSFPSGHSITAGASAFSIFIRNKTIGAFAVLLAVLICLSRIFFAVHYPTDIIAGFVLGAVCAVVVWKVLHKKTETLLDRIPPRVRRSAGEQQV